MIGYWIIEKFQGDKDAQGFDVQVLASNRMDMNLKATLYLPPYLRKSQSDIGEGSTVFGFSDDITGLGVALFGVDCDITYKNNADYEFLKSLTVKNKLDVTNNITSIQGDVIAGTISLTNHTHQILTMTASDAALIVGSATSGSPVAFTAFATTVPN